MASSGTTTKKQQLLEAASLGNLRHLKNLATELDDGRGIAKTVAGIKDSNGQSALHLAVAKGKVDICNYLLGDLKLDVDAKDAAGATPLLRAALGGHFSTIVYLLKKGANPNTRNEDGSTPLHWAARMGHGELLHFLLSKGVNVDAISTLGTPLQTAVNAGKHEAVKILLDHHANPNLSSHQAFPPLLSSIIIAKSLQCVEHLLEAGADPNGVACGATPLEVATCNRETEMIGCLLKAGADPNVANAEGLAPIEIAVLNGNKRAFEILFPVTSPISTYANWSFDGILRHVHSLEVRLQRTLILKKNLEVAKSEGKKAFLEKDYITAMFWYTKAVAADPSDATVLSNRSLCWARLAVGEPALIDAMACVTLKPDWPKAYYRGGAAYNILGMFEQAAEIFNMGLLMDPENKELQAAFLEAEMKSMKENQSK